VDNPVEQLLNLIFLVTARKGLWNGAHTRLTTTPTGASWQMWRDGQWQEEDQIPPAVLLPLLRRICVLLGGLYPPQGHFFAGRIEMRVNEEPMYFLAIVINDETPRAVIEHVDAEAFRTNTEPRPPLGHPFR
jgi:hypothetical protein